MGNLKPDTFNHTRIGIIGCGHLGLAIAESLIRHGFCKENIFISYKGNSSTYTRIEKSGFAECIAENEEILNEADVIFITVKPQDIIRLKEIPFSGKPLIISCMAGVPVEILKNIFKTDICRVMFSGPDTILGEKGVAAVFPYNGLAAIIINKMNLRIFETTEEDNLDIFTAGVCLPAALLQEDNEAAVKEAIHVIGSDYPTFSDLYVWAKHILPLFNTKSEKDEYIAGMATKGGVTEAIIESLKEGEPFETAIRKGIARSKEVSVKIRDSILKDNFPK